MPPPRVTGVFPNRGKKAILHHGSQVKVNVTSKCLGYPKAWDIRVGCGGRLCVIFFLKFRKSTLVDFRGKLCNWRLNILLDFLLLGLIDGRDNR